MACCHSACVVLIDGPTDPTKEEVSHDAARSSFAGDFQPAWDEAVKLHTAKDEDETIANIHSRCSRCAVALVPASKKGGKPVEVHMEPGRITFDHCFVCEDTSFLLAEATDAQRNLVVRDRDS